MKLEDLKIGSIIMPTNTEDNPARVGEMWLVTKFYCAKPKFEAICLHSQVAHRIGKTALFICEELPDYELITSLCIQPANDSLFLQHKPAETKKDLYLRWLIARKTSLGKIGDKTPYKLENGRNLFVGDIVKISREGEEHGGCLVVHDITDGYYIMGIAADCNDRKCEIKRWNVTLESGFYNRLKGDTYTAGYRSADIEVTDFKPEE